MPFREKEGAISPETTKENTSRHRIIKGAIVKNIIAFDSHPHPN
jgi:hypothetical protein